MSSEEEMAAWLRQAIGEVKAVAVAACGKADRPVAWVLRDHPGESVMIRADDGLPVVYDEGDPSDEEAAHMVLHDPRDTIARCEAELAIMDEHGPLPDCSAEMIAKYRAAGFPEAQIAAMEAMVSCARCHVPVDDAREDEEQCRPVEYPCKTVRLLASGYRHRPGYREEWKP